MVMGRVALFSAVLASWVVAALAADFSGSIVAVLEGDTIEVLHSNRPERIRLSGIDCSEKGQA
jgi:micrococcal nuclease